MVHFTAEYSMLSGISIKLKKKLSMGPLQGEKACIRAQEYTLLEFLD